MKTLADMKSVYGEGPKSRNRFFTRKMPRKPHTIGGDSKSSAKRSEKLVVVPLQSKFFSFEDMTKGTRSAQSGRHVPDSAGSIESMRRTGNYTISRRRRLFPAPERRTHRRSGSEVNDEALRGRDLDTSA